jgi:DNA-binding FadR family transcriptional regulator
MTGDEQPTGSGAKLAEVIASRIETLVMERGWPLGEILGSEPELIEQFGVSRAVFREAVRIVEHHGVARMRRGPKGGLVVTAPDLRAVQRPTTLYLDFKDVSSADLFTVRSTLELAAVELLSARLDERGVEALRDALVRERRAGIEGIHDAATHDLHVLIAELTENPALRLFVETLASLTHTRTGELEYVPEELEAVHHAHDLIVEALIAGDTALAQRRMRLHLRATANYYRQRSAAGTSPAS